MAEHRSGMRAGTEKRPRVGSWGSGRRKEMTEYDTEWDIYQI